MNNSIGIIGMAVMGQNLAMNIADKGYNVGVYNRSVQKTNEFIETHKHPNIEGFEDLDSLINSLKTPRIVLLMIKAGTPVDKQIDDLINLIGDGDIIIDGGNSNYMDTQRRYLDLKKKSIHFVGTGISGGEEGARYGPSIMPGGSFEAWKYIEGMFSEIAAKARDGFPCCAWLGSDGSGHFVKMVHNGIEYGDMQLISETYQIMKDFLKMDLKSIGQVFSDWNKGKLNSYLIKITSDILQFKDPKSNKMLIEQIMDKAEQKGTGRWTVEAGLEYGEPVTLINQAVFQRVISSNKRLRKLASKFFDTSRSRFENDIQDILERLENALYISKLMSYAQGFQLLRTGADVNNWQYSLAIIAAIWRSGCIIQSAFLDEITTAYQENPKLENLLFAEYFQEKVKNCIDDLRVITKLAIENHIPVPGLSTAVAYFDSLKSYELPTNLIQAQRDYFGSHGYRRIDDDKINHTNWQLS